MTRQPTQRRKAPLKAALALAGASICLPLVAAHGAPGHPSGSSDPNAGWWRDAVFYEIFVRSFADSDGDGIGDFKGLTEKLDYLNDGDPATNTDLGVDAVWLMPIHPSPSYHGYDVTDYTAVNPEYGTLEDFDAFIAAAKARGIKVVIDFVMNHSSREHPWFINARGGADASKRGWYTWRDKDPGWTQPWGPGPVWHKAGDAYYYGLFWGGMPDLNLSNPAVEAEMIRSMRFWLDRGVAGFRVDAARHFFESADGKLSDQPEAHALMRRVRKALQESHPEAFLIGEIWTDAETVATYGGDKDEFQMAFGFDTAGALKESARDGLKAAFNQTQAKLAKAYKAVGRNFEAPFLANHDMARTMRTFNQDAGAMRVAAAALFAQPGSPFIYYGEELGMVGGPSKQDEDKRTPMPWTAEGPTRGFTQGVAWRAADEAEGVDVASQRGKPGSLWTLFRDLITLRKGYEALSDGDARLIPTSKGGRGLTALLRTHGKAQILFVVNFNAAPTQPFTVKAGALDDVLMSEGLISPPKAKPGGLLAFEGLKGRGFAFIALK